MGLTGRFAFGVAVISAFAILAAAHPSRARNSPASAGQTAAPAGQPASPSQAPSSATPPANSPTPSPTPIPDANKPPETSHGQHTVTVAFDYDFRLTPACTAKITKNCVQQFVAYDISAGANHATMLFPIALPPNPVGAVPGITGTSPKLDFESGKHLIAVSAM